MTVTSISFDKYVKDVIISEKKIWRNAVQMLDHKLLSRSFKVL